MKLSFLYNKKLLVLDSSEALSRATEALEANNIGFYVKPERVNGNAAVSAVINKNFIKSTCNAGNISGTPDLVYSIYVKKKDFHRALESCEL